MNREKLTELVIEKIESEEAPGYKAGGSGHLSHVDYTLHDVSLTDNKVTYNYSVFVQSEFSTRETKKTITATLDNGQLTHPKMIDKETIEHEDDLGLD